MVQLQSGQRIVVVQEADERFSVGESVQVIKADDGITRVRHAAIH